MPAVRAAPSTPFERSFRPLLTPQSLTSKTFATKRASFFCQERMHHWLHGWLLVHIPLSLALILLGAVHARGSAILGDICPALAQQKKLAQRIRPELFQKADAAPARQTLAQPIASLIALIWVAYNFATRDSRVYSSGRLSEPHAVFETQCAACHVQQPAASVPKPKTPRALPAMMAPSITPNKPAHPTAPNVTSNIAAKSISPLPPSILRHLPLGLATEGARHLSFRHSQL